MTLTKLVNGERITMTDEEEAGIRAEWKSNREAPPRLPEDAAYDNNSIIKAVIEVLAEETGKDPGVLMDSVKAKYKALIR